MVENENVNDFFLYFTQENIQLVFFKKFKCKPKSTRP